MPPAAPSPRPAPDLDPAHDAGFTAASARAAAALARTPFERIGQPLGDAGHELRIGTASWTDPTLVRGAVFYPPGVSTADARLRWYASQFSVVEVDATYYALPQRAVVERWVARTGPAFQFHVKAHALMTGQPTEVARLPEDLRRALPAALADRVTITGPDLPGELLDEVWTRFLGALAPLRAASRLGGVLLQYPRWFLPIPGHETRLADAARRLAGIPAAVELRNHRWFDGAPGGGGGTDWTLAMLRDLGLAHVVVEGPQGLESSVPLIPAVSAGRAVVRLHGRRSAAWEAAGVPTVERYRYLYSTRQLAGLVPMLRTLALQSERTAVFLNNCYGNYGTTNARELVALLA